MPAVERLLGLGLAASGLLHAGCRSCEQEPPYQREIGVERPATEPCPDHAHAQGEFVGFKTLLGETVQSIDSEPRREEMAPGHQSCCYEGTFVAQGASESGTFCTDVAVSSPNDKPSPSACPGATLPFDPRTLFHRPRPGQAPLGLFADDITQVTAGPTVQDFKPGTEFCRYTATLKSDGEVCR